MSFHMSETYLVTLSCVHTTLTSLYYLVQYSPQVFFCCLFLHNCSLMGENPVEACNASPSKYNQPWMWFSAKSLHEFMDNCLKCCIKALYQPVSLQVAQAGLDCLVWIHLGEVRRKQHPWLVRISFRTLSLDVTRKRAWRTLETDMLCRASSKILSQRSGPVCYGETILRAHHLIIW